MTSTETTRLPWHTGRWTPLEGGADWREGMRAEYAALVGTPAELAAAMGERTEADPPGEARAVYTSGYTSRSPAQYGRDLLHEAQQERPDVATQLVAVVWDGWPGYRWDGSRNQALVDPDHALAIVTTLRPSAPVRTALLARLRARHAEQQLRETAVELWQNTRNIALVHQVTGLARSTVYALLRAQGIEPTERPG